MKYLQHIAWDNGYDTEKIMIDVDEISLFPSVSYIPVSNRNVVLNEDEEIQSDKIVIEYEGTEYFLGNYAITQDGQGGDRNFEIDKFKDNTEVAKLLAGLSLLSNDDTIEVGKLVSGLSIRDYHALKEELEHFYNDKLFKFKVNGKGRKVIINDVLCIPQGIGSYYDNILTYSGEVRKNELLDSRYGLIDIGGNTVDMFIGEGVEPRKATDFGLNIGLSDVFKNVFPSIPYNKVQYYYLQGKDNIKYGKTTYTKLQSKVDDKFQTLAEQIYKKVISSWNRMIDDVETIVLTGGGAVTIGDYLKKKFVNRKNKNVVIVKDPQVSNVRGYYKLGVYHSKRFDDNEEA